MMDLPVSTFCSITFGTPGLEIDKNFAEKQKTLSDTPEQLVGTTLDTRIGITVSILRTYNLSNVHVTY